MVPWNKIYIFFSIIKKNLEVLWWINDFVVFFINKFIEYSAWYWFDEFLKNNLKFLS